MRLNVTPKPEDRLAAALKADADVQALLDATPAQINAWVDANITTVAQVRRVLKLLLKLMVIILRRGP